MALNIKDPETDRLARKLAGLTGESITDAVRQALEARIESVETRKKASLDVLQGIIDRGRARPILDHRTEDEILGYDENGIPQ